MRRLHKSWSDKKPFTRHVRWYSSSDDGRDNIRLVFDDEHGVAKIVYASSWSADSDWQQFKAGELTTIAIRNTRGK